MLNDPKSFAKRQSRTDWRQRLRHSLRKLWGQLLPLVAYFSLVLGRRRTLSAGSEPIIEIVDRGSDITIVSFAGMAALHGGMVNFEFVEVLRRVAFEPNIVFVRDPLCANYHVCPDGRPAGLEYYAEKVREAVATTGAEYVLAIGTSVGGMAALHFGTRLAFDQVIAFSPTWPPYRYLPRRGVRELFRQLGCLFRRPAVFVERLVMGQMARVSLAGLLRTVGRERILDLEAQLAAAERPPRITVFHAQGCDPDRETASAIAAATTAEIVALPTFFHNSSGHLKASGQLVPAILSRIETHREARRANSGVVAAADPRQAAC